MTLVGLQCSWSWISISIEHLSVRTPCPGSFETKERRGNLRSLTQTIPIISTTPPPLPPHDIDCSLPMRRNTGSYCPPPSFLLLVPYVLSRHSLTLRKFSKEQKKETRADRGQQLAHVDRVSPGGLLRGPRSYSSTPEQTKRRRRTAAFPREGSLGWRGGCRPGPRPTKLPPLIPNIRTTERGDRVLTGACRHGRRLQRFR